MARLVETGRVEETIHFAPTQDARLTYALLALPGLASPKVRHATAEVAVAIPEPDAKAWAEGEDVGIYFRVDLGPRGTLSVVLEKDFACLDRRDADNIDAFPNPKTT